MDVKYAYYRTSAGYKLEGKDDTYLLTAGGGTKTVASFWHDGNFTPLDYVPKSRTITINGVVKNLATDQVFTTADTVTRVKGGTAGSFVYGDVTLVAGANTTINQSGNNITFTSSDTTYTAGSGLTLSGTTFSLPITTSGTGNVVSGVSQTANGLTVYLSAVPTTSDLANYIPNAQKGVANGVATLDGQGIIPTNQLPSFVDDVLEFANLAGFPATGETGKIYVALDTNKTYRWGGSSYVYITSGAVDSVNGKTGVVVINKADVGLGNADNTTDATKQVLSATKWTTARTITISGVTATTQTIDGSGNINIPITAIPSSLLTGTANISTTGSAGTLTNARTIAMTGDGVWSVNFDGSTNVTSSFVLANTGVTAGSYDKVTVDAKGRVTAGQNETKSYNTTISGSATVIHNLGTSAVNVFIMDTVTKYRIEGRIKITDNNKVDVEFDSPIPNVASVTITKLNI